MTEYSTPSDRGRSILRYWPLVLAIGVSLLTKQYLQAGISTFSIVFLVLFIAGFGLVYRLRGDDFPWAKYVASASAALLAIAILVGILITPLSAYIYWFDTFRNGVPQGGVGTIFVLLITLFASILSPLVLVMGLLWPILILTVVILYLLAVILQTDILLYLLLASLGIASVYYMVKRTRRGAGGGGSLFAVFLVLVTFIGASLFPRVSNPTGSDLINKKIYPNLRKFVVRVLPKFPMLYAVPGYGISFDEKKLGARPNLLDSPLFEVEGPPGEVVYLRTRAFDTYDGKSWTMAGYLQNQRVDNLMLNNFIAANEEPQGDYLTLSVRARTFSYIPYTLDTKTVYFEDSLPSLRSGNTETGFELAKPFENGTKIFVERHPDGTIRETGLSPPERNGYLQLPDDLPDELRVIAEGLARDAGSQAEILGRIEAFLAENYSYNLDVEEFLYEEGSDFAYSFLFQKEGGYCVHFATSFILLARLNGVPARYSTGYLAYIPPDGSVGVVSGLSSHAWPEVWLQDTGWINWEATPAANIANYTTFGNEWFFNLGINFNSATERQLQGLLGQDISDQPVAVIEETASSRDGRLILIVVGAVAALMLLGFLGYRFAYPAIRFAADERGRFYFSMRHLTRKLERRGVADPSKVGWVAWSSDVKHKIGSDGVKVDDMVGLLLELTYGDEPYVSKYSSRLASFRKYMQQTILRRRRAS